MFCMFVFFFFFKQKTAYEMRISDWSSDVCSSDLALARTLQIVERCRFSLDELAYQYPEERDNPALTPQQTLPKLTCEGAAERYPERVPDSVRASPEPPLRLIGTLQYAPSFPPRTGTRGFARSQVIGQAWCGVQGWRDVYLSAVPSTNKKTKQ